MNDPYGEYQDRALRINEYRDPTIPTGAGW